jgi:hypothetical protein
MDNLASYLEQYAVVETALEQVAVTVLQGTEP